MMGKSHSKTTDDSRDLKKLTTRRLKLGIKFGKDVDGGIEAGLACGYEKKMDRVFGSKRLSPIREEDERPLIVNDQGYDIASDVDVQRNKNKIEE